MFEKLSIKSITAAFAFTFLAATIVPDRATAETRCGNAVRQVAWDYNGNRNWNNNNVRRLCRGRESSRAPAECFRTVMHGGINWGRGTQWKWENAINLCQGTPHPEAPVMCFRAQMLYGRQWPDAIQRCKY